MIRFFSRHPTAANLLMLGLIIIGLTALPTLKRETFPEFAPPYILASVIYPGASPQEVEQSLCMRMEDAIDGLANIVESRCEAVEGSASMIIKLTSADVVSRMLVDVQTQIGAINDFPSQVELPIVRELDWNEPVIDVAIKADMPMPELKAYAESLKRTLKLDYGVSLVDISGFSDHQLRVEIDPTALRQLDMNTGDIANIVSQQNINLPSGNLELEERNYLLRFDARQVTPETLGTLIVGAGSDGSVIRLADIAQITDRFELDEQKTLFNSTPSAILRVSKNKADDALRVKERVAEFVAAESALAPQGVELVLTNDLSSILWDRLTMMVRNGGQGVILVFAVMWVFFSFRYSFWVAAGLPVAFLGSMYLMAAFGLSINIMSLVALLMAIGIMMDDAIVISESIASHIDKGQPVPDAVLNGVKKVMPGVLSSYLTTICIFGSLIFIQGEMGAVLRVVPQVLILVLTLSLVEAFLILPNHLHHSLSHAKQKKATSTKRRRSLKARFLRRFEVFRNYQFVTMVTTVVRWRYGFVGTVIGLLFASFALLAGGAVKFVGFPELDGDVIEARVILPPGSSLSQTESVVSELVQSAKIVGQRLSDSAEQGRELVLHITEQYNYNADADERGPHIATVRLDLLSAEVRHTRIDDFVDAWEDATSDLSMPINLSIKQPAMGPGGKDLEIRMQHDDLDMLKSASIETQQFISSFNGVSGVLDDMRMGKPEIRIALRPGAESFGVNGQMIASQLRTGYYGQTADEIQIGPENIKIQVMLAKDRIGDLQALMRFPIVLNSGEQVPLASIATLDYQRNYVRIQRIDGLRTLTVSADVRQSIVSSAEVLREFRQVLQPQLLQNYPGLRFNFEGAAKDTAETGQSMATGFALGIFGVFVILSFQFRSYLEPFIVLLAIPLALIGVLWGHWLLGYPLSMPSVMGFVSLAGVVVNDSILLVQYIRHHLDKGDDIYESVVQASRERFRAVFLTSLTTAAGLLPLLMETSLQAQVIKPMVISIVFGIFTSTLLVLFMVPSAYAILGDFGVVKRHDSLT
ncbi:efflux RND transporter permease subunit [Thaumasiovibrio sp. DFM-14]|uniref:efflux RND transporter permease subunit n=1 Tax=Thaumasiovibrio sp. DFM-14 TaxID=3384792 RepID=UPI0039A34F04